MVQNPSAASPFRVQRSVALRAPPYAGWRASMRRLRADWAVAETYGPTEATDAIRAAMRSRREPGDVALDRADVDPEGGRQRLGGGVPSGGQAQLLDEAVLPLDPKPGQMGLGRSHRSDHHHAPRLSPETGFGLSASHHRVEAWTPHHSMTSQPFSTATPTPWPAATCRASPPATHSPPWWSGTPPPSPSLSRPRSKPLSAALLTPTGPKAWLACGQRCGPLIH